LGRGEKAGGKGKKSARQKSPTGGFPWNGFRLGKGIALRQEEVVRRMGKMGVNGRNLLLRKYLEGKEG